MAMYGDLEFVDDDGLMSLWPRPNRSLPRTAWYLAKILQGALPAI